MKQIFLMMFFIIISNIYSNNENPKPSYFDSFKNLDFLEDCDACGCSASGGSIGFNSMLNEKFIGVRYIHQSYKSRDGVFNNSPWIDESFSTIQLWGRVPISEKIEIMALVPYHFLNREKANSSQNLNGIGDVTLMGFYNLYQTKSDSVSLEHKLLLGAGIKLPTGKYDNLNNESVNPSFQLGTGSWDFNIATEYTIKMDNFGLNAILGYVIKTENDKNYQFGNQFNYGGTFFYHQKINNLMFVPQIGMSGETYESNKDFGENVPFTKGDILFTKLGFELGYDKFSFGANAMLPISQNLTGGRVEANYRLAFNLNYSL